MLCAIILIAFAKNISAQESMIPEVNYAYLERLITAAKENYPKIKNLEQKIGGAKAGVSAASVAWLDPFSFNYYYRPDGNQGGDPNNINTLLNGPQFGVSLNLGSVLTKPFNVKKAKTDLNIAREESKEYALSIEAEVKARYYTYIQQLTSLKVISKNALDLTSLNTQIKTKFERGEESLLAYNQAIAQLGSVYIQKVQTEGSVLIAKSSLEELLGKKLEEIK